MDAYIVLVAVGADFNNYSSTRRYCEMIENTQFESNIDSDWKVHQKLLEDFEGEEKEKAKSFIEVYAISDFIDLVNDECFNDDNYFISYVYVTK